MNRFVLTLLGFTFLLSSLAQAKSREIAYGGPSDPPLIWIGVSKTTSIVLPSDIAKIVTTLSNADLSYVLEDRRLLLTPLREKLQQALIFYLADGRLYEVQVRDRTLSRHDWRRADSRVEIVDPGDKAERRRPKANAAVHRQDDPRRVLLTAMWRAHLPAPDGVSVKVVNTRLTDQDDDHPLYTCQKPTRSCVEIRRIRIHESGKYVGHTLLVSNHSAQPLPLDITSMTGDKLVVIAAVVLKDGRAIPGDVVAPKGKGLMYLIYEGD